MGALVGEPGGGDSFGVDPVGFEWKTLETGISLHGGLSTGDFERWLKGAL